MEKGKEMGGKPMDKGSEHACKKGMMGQNNPCKPA